LDIDRCHSGVVAHELDKAGEIHVASIAVARCMPARAIRQLVAQVGHREVRAEPCDEPRQLIAAAPLAARTGDLDAARPGRDVTEGDRTWLFMGSSLVPIAAIRLVDC
jgi:hypothetical protein